MDTNKCIKKPRKERTIHISIRITKNVSKWMAEKKYSPTAIFNEAVEELGYKKE